jgi:hypothetical protein
MGSDWQEELEPGAGAATILKALAEALIEIPVIAFLGLAVTMGFWLPVAVDFLLRTWQLGKGPAIVWAVGGIGFLLFLSGMAHFVGWSFKLIPYARELKAAKRSGNKVRIDLALDAWRIWNRRRRFSALWIAMLSIFLIIPAWVALAKSPPTPAPAGDTGKPRQATRNEQVRPLAPDQLG